jgi:peptidoglycan/LPS O-acetylase OafA/YrhL
MRSGNRGWPTRGGLPASAGDQYQVLLAAVAAVGTLLAASLSFATLESWFLRLKDSVGKPHALPVQP